MALIQKNGKITTSFAKGECFGALEIIGNTNRIIEAVPSEKMHLLALHVFWLKLLYGDNYGSVLALSLIKSAFANNEYLKKLNLNFLDGIFNFIIFKYYEKETEIIKAGDKKIVLLLFL